MYKFVIMAMALLIAGTLAGCGDSSEWNLTSNNSPNGDTYVFPTGKSVLTFSAFSSATLAAPIRAVDLSVTLPLGMSINTTTGRSGPIDSASITPGSALSGTNLAFGSYSVSTRKVRLSMTTTSANYRSGEFLRLSCTVAPSTTISLGDLRALNAPVSIIKSVGYDPLTLSTVTLTNNVTVNIGASQ